MVEEKKESLFIVSIIGKGIHFEVPITDMGDFRNLEDILKRLKKKLLK